MLFEAIGAPIWVADGSPSHEAAQAAIRAGVPDLAAWFADPAGGQVIAGGTRLVDANEAAADLFGVSRDTLLRDGLTPFRTPSGVQALARLFTGLIEGRAVVEEEVRFVRADGALIDVIVKASASPAPIGWSRVVVSALDVTERNAGQARLNRAQSDLARMSRITTLGQLAASLAHELTQPLTAVISHGRAGRLWLAREAQQAVETSNSLDMIMESAERASAILGRVRDMVSGAEPRFAAVDLAAAIIDTTALLDRELRINGIELRLEIARPLPPVFGDRIQIEQVLVNLAMNAIQAMNTSDTRILTIHAAHRDASVLVDMVDTGRGFGGRNEAAFAPLLSSSANGMGMGLAICRSIMTVHGGSVKAQDAPTGGARLSLRFPSPSQEAVQ